MSVGSTLTVTSRRNRPRHGHGASLLARAGRAALPAEISLARLQHVFSVRYTANSNGFRNILIAGSNLICTIQPLFSTPSPLPPHWHRRSPHCCSRRRRPVVSVREIDPSPCQLSSSSWYSILFPWLVYCLSWLGQKTPIRLNLPPLSMLEIERTREKQAPRAKTLNSVCRHRRRKSLPRVLPPWRA